jgi:hypothetical protein
VIHPANTTHSHVICESWRRRINAGTIHPSTGLEDPDDLIDDQARFESGRESRGFSINLVNGATTHYYTGGKPTAQPTVSFTAC